MTEKTAVMSSTGSGVAIFAIVALILLVWIGAFLVVGGSRGLFSRPLNLQISPRGNPPAQELPSQQSLAQPTS